MNRLSFVAVISCLALASLSVTPAAADTWNKKTVITITEAVRVPGATLEPGKYVMKLLESSSNRFIVQIFNEREDHLYTTILSIPNSRLQPTGDSAFQFWETPAGEPKAMRAWFYPGDNFGQEFAYPKHAAVQIAKETNQVVPTVSQTEDLSKATVATVDKSGSEAVYTPAPAPHVVAQNRAPEPTPQAAPEGTRTRTEELPKTASPIPMIALTGLLVFACGAALRGLRKHAS